MCSKEMCNSIELAGKLLRLIIQPSRDSLNVVMAIRITADFIIHAMKKSTRFG